ncbi:ATP-binding protein [Paenibacillus caseinilyticus]|uniref:Anti-sigma regulatory factor n=1 Tax=Paenibacillus mucilaginosus K02 TaxID=997761 RepID=I0BTS0_9BACL|nr:ATP-binding protein [Paenibacillus mucilaginosus]AFH65767.1 anti-sigma regulatory factor [Paenibacillus mucilaginosus K02]
MSGGMKAVENAAGKEIILRLPLQPEGLMTVRMALYGVAVRMGFSFEAIEDLKVAVSEACNHALLRLAGSRQDAALMLVFTMREEELVVRIGITGAAVTFRDALEPVSVQPETAESLESIESGRIGLYLLQALVDEVIVVPGETEGSEEIRLCKRLS